MKRNIIISVIIGTLLRTAGEELEVSRKRAEHLANLQLVKTVEDQKGGDPKSPSKAEG